MPSPVYVPTKNRPELLAKCLAKLDRNNVIPIVVTESRYEEQVQIAGAQHVVRLHEWDKGIAYARMRILLDAQKRGYKSLMMIDDDHALKPGSNWRKMLRLTERDDVVGIGAWKRHYSFLLRGFGAGRASEGLWLHRGTLGYQVWTVNVSTAMAIGGFDEEDETREDQELCHWGMARMGVPWYLFREVEAYPLATTVKSHEQGGGIGGGASRVEKEERSYERLRNRWGDELVKKLNSHPSTYMGGKKEPQVFRFNHKRLVEIYVTDRWPLEDIRTEREWDWAK